MKRFSFLAVFSQLIFAACAQENADPVNSESGGPLSLFPGVTLRSQRITLDTELIR